MLEDLWGLGKYAKVLDLPKKPYIESVQCHLERWIPKYRLFHCSSELAFDPSDFVCGPSEIVAHGFNQGIAESVIGRWVSELKSEGR